MHDEADDEADDEGARDAPRVVVAAAILDGERLLAARRSAPAHLAGGWELPGGKVEPGEGGEAALVRECREELGVEVRLGRRIAGAFRLSDGLVLEVWTAAVVEGEPAPLQDHDALRWLGPGEWWDVAWLPGDVPAVAAVARTCGIRPGTAADPAPSRRAADGPGRRV